MRHNSICPKVVTFFGLAALAFAQPRPLDNIASRQYQHEIRPCGSLSTAGCTSWAYKGPASVSGS